jgi:DNA-binding transcriptional MerR regulator
MKSSRARAQTLLTGAVAKRLGITPNGVRYLAFIGKLPAEFTTSGLRLFRLEDVERLARARGVGGVLEPPDAA